MSKIHMEFILDNNNENKENSNNISFPTSISFQDPIILDDTIEEPPQLPEDFKVDETDSKILASLYQKDEVYPNFSTPKGLALIINNREFAHSQYNPRMGTEVDESNIRKLLVKLGYQVERTHHNLSAGSMLRTAKIFAANELHKNFDSCVVVVLTHGQYDHFIGSDGEAANVHDFLACFNASNAKFLKGKPKLFFFQACRGDSHDYGTDATDIGKISSLFSCMRSSPPRLQRNFNNNTNNNFESSLFPSPPPSTSSSSSSSTTFPIATSIRFNGITAASRGGLKREKRPTEGDMVIAFATTPRYVSWRNSNSGSWFIQSICEIFGKFAATEDIGSLLIKVNKRVADAYQSSNAGQKQIPEFVIRLQKKFYFFPGIKAEHLQQS
uniref:Caspase-3 n=1 Tax=Panagrolaimus davidi TaxID=227884 RepID=A0A914P8N5_9BILA